MIRSRDDGDRATSVLGRAEAAAYQVNNCGRSPEPSSTGGYDKYMPVGVAKCRLVMASVLGLVLVHID